MSQPRWSAARNPYCNKNAQTTHTIERVQDKLHDLDLASGHNRYVQCERAQDKLHDLDLASGHKRYVQWCESTCVQAGSRPLLRVHTQPIGIAQGNNCASGLYTAIANSGVRLSDNFQILQTSPAPIVGCAELPEELGSPDSSDSKT